MVPRLLPATVLALMIGPRLIDPVSAQVSDHLKCYRVKDAAPRATYTADLGGLAPEPGCIVKVPGQLLCVEATKTNVQPSPPFSVTGSPTRRFLCYKVKCKKTVLPTAVQWTDQFGRRVLTPRTSSLLCAPEICSRWGGNCNTGLPGSSGGECCPGEACVRVGSQSDQGVCRGGTCSQPLDCPGGNCVGGSCCATFGSPCSLDCCPGFECGAIGPPPPGTPTCCKSAGTACVGNPECCSQSCDTGTMTCH